MVTGQQPFAVFLSGRESEDLIDVHHLPSSDTIGDDDVLEACLRELVDFGDWNSGGG